MPGGDRTGPNGMGPRTGRAMGYCSGNDAPGFASGSPRGGMGRGRGGRGGFGRGARGPGAGYGRGYGRGFGGGPAYFSPWPAAAPYPADYYYDAEADPGALRAEIEDIKVRLDRLAGLLEQSQTSEEE